MKSEKIGNVTLDYTCYSGTDLYCDGDVEQEILEIVKNNDPSSYGEIIEQKGSWPVLYHLSKLRENIVGWLPIKKGAKVLEVGSGCGAITGGLAERAGSVDCVDLSKQRSMINAYRHKACDNVVIHVGNFQDIEPTLPTDYDLICLIGVFEYGQAYIGGKKPYEEFLNILKRHLAPEGQLVIAIESRLGLKYFAGCREDHLGTFFSGVQGYPKDSYVRTFTRNELLDIAKRCGFAPTDCHMYYPYPDYKFMHTLFSDRHLPKQGECKDNIRNFDRSRYLLFDEKAVFDTLIREGQFPLFSNSYLLVLGPQPEVTYARFSNDREEQSRILTLQYEDGSYRKQPLSESSKPHLQMMSENYYLLQGRYQGSELTICPCDWSHEEGCTFPALSGISLETLLDEALERGDMETFERLVLEFARRISYGEKEPIADMDLIFSNILVDGDTWNVIDYEWVVKEQVLPATQVYRALYCYQLENPLRQAVDLRELLAKLGISDRQATMLEREEMNFQQQVTRGHLSLGEIREVIGNEIYTLPEGGVAAGSAAMANRLQVYTDQGEGFVEETSYFPRAGADGYELSIPGNAKALRLDPCSNSCLVVIEKLLWNDAPIPMERVRPNGRRLGENMVIFKTMDPGLRISLSGFAGKETENILKVKFNILPLPEEMREALPDYTESLLQKVKGKVLG